MTWGATEKTLSRKVSGLKSERPDNGMKIRQVPVKDIIIPDNAREPDAKTVAFIAESIRVNKLIHPIAVRYEFDSLRQKSTTTLVAGGIRLAAYKMLGKKFIPCTSVEDDDNAVRLVQISENLFCKGLTALERAEQLVEWITLAEQQLLEVSGHNVRKPQGGRPEGGNAKLARRWAK